MRLISRPVSVVALRGGFGNQLFAWAYGQRLIDQGHSVAFDPGSGLGRGYALRGLIPKRRLLPLPPAVWRRIVAASAAGTGVIAEIPIKIEDQTQPPLISYDQKHFSFHWGYWQSLDYFSKSRVRVQEQLEAWLAMPPTQLDACAVHVRRGDYVSDAGAAAVMGVLPLSYYSRAIERMKSLGYQDFVIYSDDRSWAREHLLPMDPAMRVAETSETNDFVNMASSKALITANSSFSWWAGFLVESRGGSVVAPAGWFADPKMDSSRLIPDTWITL